MTKSKTELKSALKGALNLYPCYTNAIFKLIGMSQQNFIDLETLNEQQVAEIFSRGVYAYVNCKKDEIPTFSEAEKYDIYRYKAVAELYYYLLVIKTKQADECSKQTTLDIAFAAGYNLEEDDFNSKALGENLELSNEPGNN